MGAGAGVGVGGGGADAGGGAAADREGLVPGRVGVRELSSIVVGCGRAEWSPVIGAGAGGDGIRPLMLCEGTSAGVFTGG